MQEEIPLVSRPQEVTPGWMTQVLQGNNYRCTIGEISAESIGTGQVGQNVRFSLKGEGNHPASVVGKFISPDPVSRATGIAGFTYAREVHFYRRLRPLVKIQTPMTLFVDIDEETHDFILLMEDLTPGVQGDQIAGGSVAQAELALRQAAHLHGPCWGADNLEYGELISSNSRPETRENTLLLWTGVLDGFLARYGARLTDAEKDMVELFGEYAGKYLAYTGPTTLIHGDYRLDNMLFDGVYPLAIVDWQTLAIGAALQDVAYYMGTSLGPRDRRRAEERLLGIYLDTLRGYGVDFSSDECWHYYRHYAPAGLVMAVMASMLVGETERGNDMFMAMTRGSVNMCYDLDTVALLESL